MIYRFSPHDLEMMYEVIKGVPDSIFVAAYMSQVTGEFYMDGSTKRVLDGNKVEYDLLEEIDPKTVSFFYANPVTVECLPYEENIKAFVLAHSPDAIGAVCIGVDCEKEFAQDLMMNGWQYFHWLIQEKKDRFLWRLFFSKDEAAEYIGHFFSGFEAAGKWVQALPGTLTPPPGGVTLKDMRRR
jgi:hypothetical protein